MHRKFILFCCIGIFCVFNLTTQSYNGQPLTDIGFKVAYVEPALKGKINSNFIRESFEKLFRQHTMLNVYTIVNESEMLQYQSGTSFVGMLETASNIASIDIRKVSNNVVLSLKFTSATTNTIIASKDYSLPKSDIENIAKLNMAIGNICVNIFDSIDVTLSATNRANFKAGKFNAD